MPADGRCPPEPNRLLVICVYTRMYTHIYIYIHIYTGVASYIRICVPAYVPACIHASRTYTKTTTRTHRARTGVKGRGRSAKARPKGGCAHPRERASPPPRCSRRVRRRQRGVSRRTRRSGDEGDENNSMGKKGFTHTPLAGRSRRGRRVGIPTPPAADVSARRGPAVPLGGVQK